MSNLDMNITLEDALLDEEREQAEIEFELRRIAQTHGATFRMMWNEYFTSEY